MKHLDECRDRYSTTCTNGTCGCVTTVYVEHLHRGRAVTIVHTPVTGDPNAEPLPFYTERPSCNAAQK